MKTARLPIALMLIAAFLNSCSIKEDRTECPNWLLLVLDNALYGDGKVVSDLSCALSGEGGWTEMRYLPSVRAGARYGIEVPEGTVDCLVCVGKPAGLEPGKGMVISYGSECPELYTHCSSIKVDSECHTDTVRLHKNYCRVSFHMESVFASVSDRDVAFRVTGNVCGCDMKARPLLGEYMCETVPDSGMKGAIRIPRQIDSSLKLSIVVAGQVIRTFPLGRYIEMNGYDWSAEDLSDVDVDIVFEVTESSISINMFEKNVELEICV